MQELSTKQERLRFWEMLPGVFLSPSDTLSQIAQQRPVVAALGFVIILEIIGHVLPDRDMMGLRIISLNTIWDIAFGVLRLLVFAGLVHGIIRLFKEGGSYRGTLCALAFAWAPILLFYLLYLLNTLASFSYTPLWPWPSTLLDLNSTQIFSLSVAILIVIWVVTLGVMAIRAHYDLKVMGAIVAYIVAALAHGVIFRVIERLFAFLRA